MNWRRLLLATLVSAWPCVVAAAERVETIPTRPGVTQGLYVMTPTAKPWAVAVLYIGGEGTLSLKPSGPAEGLGNFLLRIRNKLLNSGLLLVYPDAPSDKPSGYKNFRSDPRHADDARAILAWVHRQSDAPIFLIGTSRGTVSAAYIAGYIEAGSLAGVALTSSITRSIGQANKIDRSMLDAIRLPTLVMANKGDKCSVTPPDDVPFLLDGLKNAPRKDKAILSGGLPAIASDCEGKAAHGFYGLEDEATKTLVDWMKSVAAARN